MWHLQDSQQKTSSGSKEAIGFHFEGRGRSDMAPGKGQFKWKVLGLWKEKKKKKNPG